MLVDGQLVAKRWVGKDGKRKTGRELEQAMMQVELEDIVRRLSRIAKGLG